MSLNAFIDVFWKVLLFIDVFCKVLLVGFAVGSIHPDTLVDLTRLLCVRNYVDACVPASPACLCVCLACSALPV